MREGELGRQKDVIGQGSDAKNLIFKLCQDMASELQVIAHLKM